MTTVSPVDVTCAGFVAGGSALSRSDDGQVTFVRGALPGERVRISITERRKDFARADVVEVLDPSPDRVSPPCPHVPDGCGGCDWQHVNPVSQPRHKAAIVADALRRLAHIADVQVSPGTAGPSMGHRTVVRAMVRGGRAGYRMAARHEMVAVRSCGVAHPQLEALLVAAEWGTATEVTLRIGAATGDRLALVDPRVDGVVLPRGSTDTVVVGRDDVAAGSTAAFHEIVDGVRFRISATSFFQTQPAGAEALVQAVAAAVHAAAGSSVDAPAGSTVDSRNAHGDEMVRDDGVLLDLYGGVGLFAATVGRRFATVVSVERHGSSARDAVHNLGSRTGATAVAADVERWHPDAAVLARPRRVVVADPARAGLGRRGVDAIVGCDAARVVLVSCDAAALGRDAGLLVAAGYRLVSCQLVDVFPQTSHVEVVSRFDRQPA